MQSLSFYNQVLQYEESLNQDNDDEDFNITPFDEEIKNLEERLNHHIPKIEIDRQNNQQKRKAGRPKITVIENLTLQDVCVSDKAYNEIIDYLIDKKVIKSNPISLNQNMDVFIPFLKELFAQKYLSRKPANEEWVCIIKNSFNTQTSINTVKHGKPENNYKIPIFISEE